MLSGILIGAGVVGVISLIIRFSTKDKKENKTEKLLTIKDLILSYLWEFRDKKENL